MFPISDSAKSKRLPFVSIFIIALNIYIFYKELTVPSMAAFIESYALIPSYVNLTDISSLAPFVTAIFLHGGFLHIISNMWFLWIFGDNVEGYLGHFNYFLFYLFAGVMGNILQYVFFPSAQIPMLGASGAISGILGAYYVLFPHSKVKTLLFIFIFITIIEIPAVIYLFYWFFIQLFSGITTLASIAQGGVAFWAHVGGFLTGVITATTFRNKQSKGYIEGEIIG
ncbi:MAG: hypothetical protein A2857_04730 [Candidatus Levybacteria bacterium RIFCSPHIGHO2_01_FULL_36_15]|nr:MAG: hypothetical protein A2857_04730 [Candidatus Levybacteria bacterium RIFCSPHIGHO2_01_FULL_36_15]OGH39031.1 MAG: hypothetical protein A2905_04675 [Candidatus Levybacteria bacterium RIFCSPLOWO2_01_FULL_36_10]